MRKEIKLPLSPAEFEALCDLRLHVDFHRGKATSLLETLRISKRLVVTHYSELSK